MPVLAVYLLPAEDHPLSRIGVECMGYDVRTGERSTPLLADTFGEETILSWIGRARIFGFHATLGDALQFAEKDIAEIKERLRWIASRIAPFVLLNGRLHPIARYGINSLNLAFDEPSGRLQQLQELVVTMVNVLYQSSPYYGDKIQNYPAQEHTSIIRYGVPGNRILDRFNLHFALATSLPNKAARERLLSALVGRRGLLTQESHQQMAINSIYLLEQQTDDYFRVVEQFALRA
jgi:hypothetical protein